MVQNRGRYFDEKLVNNALDIGNFDFIVKWRDRKITKCVYSLSVNLYVLVIHQRNHRHMPNCLVKGQHKLDAFMK